jgi:hypothetical protein
LWPSKIHVHRYPSSSMVAPSGTPSEYSGAVSRKSLGCLGCLILRHSPIQRFSSMCCLRCTWWRIEHTS